jgi:threonine dehydrogenase-like Zn-dependent dehydrogenase
MRSTYRAVVMPGPDLPLEVQEFPAPDLQPGGVLLHTILSEVCGTDVHLLHGKLGGVPYPIIPGHVSVGVIAGMRGVVKDVDGVPFAEGDVAAFMDVHESCGSCHACLVSKQTTRCPDRKVYGITYPASDGLLGGWSEAIWLKPGVKLLRLPGDLDAETYCGGGCGLNTAMHTVDRAEIKLGDTVVVLGVGPVGQSIVTFSALSGANRVIAIGAPQPRLEFARRMGATDTLGLDLSWEERLQQVRDQTGGRGADVVIEATGAPIAVRQALELVRDGGRVVVCGQYSDYGDIPINPHRHINKKHVELRGSWGSDYSHFHRAIAVMARHHHRYPWREMITARFDLDHIQEGLDAVASHSVVKAAVDPGIVPA